MKLSFLRGSYAALVALGLLAAAACSGADVGPGSGVAAQDGWRDGTLITPSGATPIRYEVKNGLAVLDGDMVIGAVAAGGEVTPESFANGTHDAMFQSGQLWPNATLPYRYDASIAASSSLHGTIERAVAHYNSKTQVRLYLDSTNTAPDYLLFKTNSGNGCRSWIGHGAGPREVDLDSGCDHFDTAVHEIGHAAGLLHEHNRPDRDTYVTVQKANLQRPDDFNLGPVSGKVGPFDFTSVMLYPSSTTDRTIAIDPSKPIITRKDGTSYPDPQSGKGLSAGDVTGLDFMYAYWHGPAELAYAAGPPNFVAGGGVTSFSRVLTKMDMFTIASDGKLWSAGAWDGGWKAPFAIPAQNAAFVAGGGISATSRVPEMLETYAIGPAGTLWNAGTYRDGQGWLAPFEVNAQNSARFKAGSGIAAVSRNPGILDTFVIGWNNVLWEAGAWDASRGAWQAPFQVPGGTTAFAPGAGIAAVATDANHIYTFVIGPDGFLWSAGSWMNDRWAGSFRIEPHDETVHFGAGGQLAATLRDGNVLDVFVVGGNGQLWSASQCLLTDGVCPARHWTLPAQVAPQSAVAFTPGGGVGAASRFSKHIDVATIGYNNRTWSAGYWGY